jgi:C-terminal processing protease CtpA/Prc
MSGIEIQHEGLEWVKDTYMENPTLSGNIFDGNGEKVANNLKFKFELKPIFKISNVRASSSAAAAGLLNGDKIISINNKKAHGFTMEKINNILKSEEGKTIEMEVERNGKIIKATFQLKKIL